MSASRAAKVAAAMRRQHHDGRISAYRCDHCGDWHVGNHLVKDIPRKVANSRKEADQ
jgi:ribosomal protein L32